MKLSIFEQSNAISRTICSYTFLLICLYSAFPAAAQNHWLPEHPIPAANDFTGSWVFENNDVLLTGSAGIICYYTASTDSWKYHWLSDNEEVDHLKKIQMLDDQTGYAIGWGDRNYGILYRTDDRGITWSSLPTCPLTNAMYMHFISVDSGFAAGPYSCYRTLDGGETWSVSLADSSESISDVFFLDNVYGWLASYCQQSIYQTTDFGETWTLLTMPVQQMQPELVRLFSRERGYVQGMLSSFETRNGGETWQFNSILHSISILCDWAIVDNNFSFGASPYHHYIRSFDNGLTLELIDNLREYYDYRDIQTISANSDGKIVLAGEGGHFCTSNDFGDSILLDSSLTRQRLYLVDVQPSGRIWVTGSNGTILTRATSDHDWERYSGIPDFGLSVVTDIVFIDENEIWMSTSNTYLLRSLDGGETWDEIEIGLAENEYALEIFLLPGEEFYIITNQGHIIESQNNKSEWIQFEHTLPVGYRRSYEYKGEEYLWIGINDTLYFSDDNGRTLTVQYICQNSQRIFDIHFIDTMTGFIISGHLMGYGNEEFGPSDIVRTTDGGATWYAGEREIYGSPLYDIDFLDENTGMAVGGNGHGYYTLDGGDIWTECNTGTSNHLYHVKMVDSSTAYVVGGYGTIYKCSTDIDDYHYEPTGSAIPEDVSLNAFPNPFNQSVMITCDIPDASDLDIRIYNLNGREVCNLTSGKGFRGMNQYQWDGTSNNGSMVSSGVYFILVKYENKLYSSKMILLK